MKLKKKKKKPKRQEINQRKVLDAALIERKKENRAEETETLGVQKYLADCWTWLTKVS